MLTVYDIRRMFKRRLEDKKWYDTSGTLELLHVSFIADLDTIFGEPNQEYIKKEIAWYESQSNSIYDLDPNPPKIWKEVASDNGEINSNYGRLIYSGSPSQYDSVVEELVRQPYSRRAVMVYLHPNVHTEYKDRGKNDFICTGWVSYIIRDHTLVVSVNMRSCDAVFGYRNDLAWQRHVAAKVLSEINAKTSLRYRMGHIFWHASSLHIYPRHHNLVQRWSEVYGGT